MTDPVAAIKEQFHSAMATTCKKDKCKVKLDQALPSPRALVDMDKPDLGLNANSPRCDYLFVAGTSNCCWVVPIEMTSGNNKDAKTAKAQLQAGADWASHKLPSSIKAKLLPVLAIRGSRKAQRLPMKQVRVSFRNQSSLLKLIRCGEDLSKAWG